MAANPRAIPLTVVAPRPTVVHKEAPVPPQPISAERYVCSSWLQREFDQVFSRTWLFACLESDLEEAGDFVVFHIGDESILISRTEHGDVAAFYNVCQHRGARVMTVDRGSVPQFVCPYHGWMYRPDGALVHVPDVERFAGGIDMSARGLRPVRCDTWMGMVWICLDDDAPSFDAFLGPLKSILDPYALDTMTLTGDQTVHLDCNWKAVFDNFGELYHVDHIHPQHETMFNCPAAEIHLFDHGHTGVIIDGHTINPRLPIPDEPNPYLHGQLEKFGGDPEAYQGRVVEIRDAIQRLRRAHGARRGWDYSGFSDERLSDIEQYNFFPNTMITVQPDDALIMRARPHPTDPNRCMWDKLTFHRYPDPAVADAAGVSFEPMDPMGPPPAERPEHDEFDQDDIIEGRKTMTPTIDQDVHLIRDVQAGMRSKGFSTQTLCDDEVRIQHYHDWLDYVMGERGDGHA